jgi:hypothetical protein
VLEASLIQAAQKRRADAEVGERSLGLEDVVRVGQTRSW